MNARLKLVAPIAIILVVLAAAVAIKNNTAEPKPSDIEPISATGNVDDASNALKQGVAAEDSIMSESDSDLDIIQADTKDAVDVLGAYNDNSF